MVELRQDRHVGWKCSARSCTARTSWTPTNDLAADRKASQVAAEDQGWYFTHDMPYRWDGKEYTDRRPSMHYCPRHAPVAKARVALRLAKLQAEGSAL